MNRLLALAVVFYVVTWNQWSAEKTGGWGDMGWNSNSTCSMQEVEKSQDFRDSGDIVNAKENRPATPKERAELYAEGLLKEPHRYWDVKVKRVEETELPSRGRKERP